MLLFAVAAVIIMAVLTLFEMHGRRLSWRSRVLNLQAYGLILFAGVLLMPLVAFSIPLSLITIQPFWIAFPLFLIVMDLGEYLFHRAQHAIPWLWRLHALHHSDEDMNATTAQRHFWGDQLLKAVTIWPAAALIVEPSGPVILAYSVITFWNFFAHAGLDINFGRLSWTLNSPAYHRRHHSSDPAHFNSNYAALFPIFDVIAGSYHRPHGQLVTGLDRRPRTLAGLALWPFGWPE